MPAHDKALLITKVEETLKPRMFANLMEEAVEEIQDHLDEFEISHIAAESIESEDLLAVYIAAKRAGGRSEKTLTRYAYVIGRFLSHVGIKTKDVTAQHVRDYFSHELDRGIAESTINGIRETLNAYFGWLEQEKLIRRNPVVHIESIKYQQKERTELSFSDVEIIKRHCTNIRDSAIINFLLATGCRISEMTSLNRTDVDLDAGECIVLGKGNKERMVFLDDVAILTLREYLSSRSDQNPALFVGKGNRRLLPGGVRSMMKKLSAASHVENIHPHRFRRTNFTRLLNRGMAIHEVAILAGHAKVDTTMKYFAANKARIKNSYRIHTS